MNRRKFVTLVTASGFAGLSGCLGKSQSGDKSGTGDANDDSRTSGDDTSPTRTESGGGTTTSTSPGVEGTHRTLGGNMARTSVSSAESGPADQPSAEWRYSTDPLPSEPVVANGRVYTASTRGQTLHAVDGTTGEKLWSKSIGKHAQDAPTVVDGAVYVANWNGVRSYDAESGTERWSQSFDGVEGLGSPAVVDGSVYVSGESTLLALDAASGDKKWEAAGSGSRGPAVRDGVVYGWQTGSDGKTVALDASSGDPVWTAGDAYIETYDSRAPVAVRDGRLFVPSQNGRLTAMDAANGELLWQKMVRNGDGTPWGPAALDGAVLASMSGTKGNTGRVVSFDAASGEKQWTAERGGGVTGGNVADGTYYGGIATQTGGGLFALGVEGGDERWSMSRSLVASVTPVDGGILVAEFKKGISLLR